MRLKQLAIKGFKSFANETVINFSENVIGIVGPNGAGKSNIVDAIRWVLGEQKSRELRLDQMSSVLFNGTNKRKASGLAQVSLTFENTRNLLPTEYTEVTITRMLYRSGDSEYRLNGVPCRLKDITSLFLDTGIGSNSYAIIALGMVDDILADKDNSRRRMFEQAAGISKYKARKRETLNKLKNTDGDLDRIEDLLFEIQSNLTKLEKEARRARRYFDVKESYKQHSMQLAGLRIEQLKTQQREVRQHIEQEEHRYRQFEAGIATKEAELAERRKTNLDQEKAVSGQQRALNELVGKVRSLESDRQIIQQKQQFTEQNRKQLQRDITDAETQLERLNEEIAQYREDLVAERRVEARLEQELEKAAIERDKVQQTYSNRKTDLDTAVSEQQRAEKHLSQLEQERAIQRNQLENIRLQLQRQESEQTQRQQEKEQLVGRLSRLQQEELQQQEALKELEESEAQRQAAVEEKEHALEQLKQQQVRINRELDAKRNEYQLTKSMVENLEGFPESIRYLNKSKDWTVERLLLGDLLLVEPDYRIAIEHFLEPYLNYYVVHNTAEAEQAIRLLGRSQKGKANFFLLDQIPESSPVAYSLPSGARWAMDCVEVDAEYTDLCQYLLQGVVVFDSDEEARAAQQPGLIALARSGRYLKRPASLAGGSVGLFEGKKIGRKKSLEQLKKQIERAERKAAQGTHQITEIQDELRLLREQHRHEDQRQLQHRLVQLGQERVSVQTKLDNHQQFLRQLQEQRASHSDEITKVEQRLVDLEAELTEARQATNAVRTRSAAADAGLQALSESLTAVSTAFNEQNVAFIRQQNRVTTYQQELTFRERQHAEVQSRLEQARHQVAQSGHQIEALETDKGNLEQQLQDLYQQRDALANQLSEIEQAYYQARNAVSEIEDALRHLNRQRQDVQIQINQLKEKENTIKYEVSSVAQRLRIEFGIDINSLLNSGTDLSSDLEPEALMLKVDRLKHRIDNYGDINPLAVEAFDEMKERHDTISQQRDDIVAAKDSLLVTIREIEETATAQFLMAFEKARLYFIDVFRSLFTEDDDCDLLLIDPDNPLESKIEIVAKPKGKRPQTINQLSGGEKTLTATALLFALYLLKPAPFCVFDEVDAPLDDVNISKFNRIIKKFAKESQFIIVTHNKLTMAAVDTIYGVHMAEQGISAVTPVDFRDFEHTTALEAVG